jgi:hypothetical protein
MVCYLHCVLEFHQCGSSHIAGVCSRTRHGLVLTLLLLLLLLPAAGTEEHRIYEATHPGHTGTGMGMGTHTGTTGMGTHTGMGHTDMGHTGMGNTGMGHTGVTGTGMGTHTGTTGMGTHTGTTGMGMGTMGHHEGEKKGLGEKIKEVIPGENMLRSAWVHGVKWCMGFRPETLSGVHQPAIKLAVVGASMPRKIADTVRGSLLCVSSALIHMVFAAAAAAMLLIPFAALRYALCCCRHS